MRLLILGGGGAIGSAIARHADDRALETHVGLRPGAGCPRLASHPRIRRHDVDVADAGAVEALLAGNAPDCIVMAAFPGGIAPRREDRRGMLRGACDGVLAVLEGAHAAGFGGRIVWIGSALAINRTGGTRLPNFRGAVKAAESLLAAQLAAQLGLALSEVRVFTGYGPFEQAQRLVPSLLRAALSGTRVPLAVSPAQRDWIHYEDIARLCLAVASAPSPHAGPFHACTGKPADTHEIARLLEEITGMPLVADAPFEGHDHYGDVPRGMPPTRADGIDWAPGIDLREGLARTWEWACTPAGRAHLFAMAGAA
jgi:nucleoside-diphosphate-sugar epimerase